MKLPEEILQSLTRRYQNNHKEWLSDDCSAWPLEISLGPPTEQAAIAQWDGVRAWQSAWQNWRGSGKLAWCERRWRTLGPQTLPEKLVLAGPDDLACWVGESTRWRRAKARFDEMAKRWPALLQVLPRYFGVLADYGDADFARLCDMVAWLEDHPKSNLYPRQIPVAGLDSKWLDGRKGLLTDLLAALRPLDVPAERDFYVCCGLKPPPQLIRMRILDPALRAAVGGLQDITGPWDEIAALELGAPRTFIVENLQTGLAFSEIPESVVFMGLGYGVDVLARIPWISAERCVYWGDLDTHGFAILNRARMSLPGLRSVLMDEKTLLQHRPLWVEENAPSSAEALSHLNESEKLLFSRLQDGYWGRNIRLEQERIDWEHAWAELQRAFRGRAARDGPVRGYETCCETTPIAPS